MNLEEARRQTRDMADPEERADRILELVAQPEPERGPPQNSMNEVGKLLLEAARDSRLYARVGEPVTVSFDSSGHPMVVVETHVSLDGTLTVIMRRTK